MISCNASALKKWLPTINPPSNNKRTVILRKMVLRKRDLLQLYRKVPNLNGLKNKRSLRLKPKTTKKIIRFNVSATQ